MAVVAKNGVEVVAMNLKERARQLKTDIPAVFLCLKSKDTPLAAKLVAGIIDCTGFAGHV